MDDTTITETETHSAKTGLTAKGVKRRMSRISSEGDSRKIRKQTNRLAMNLLEKIANGEVKNPKAVARAFLAAKAELTGTPAAEDIPA